MLEPALAGKPVAWFSPTYKMLTEVWRDILSITQPLHRQVNSSDHRLELVTGGVIDMWSLDSPNVARGRKYACIVVDEAAWVTNLEDAWQKVLRPTLADMAGGAWFLSTPQGMNYFHTLYQLGQDPNESEWFSLQLPTWDNPHIAPTEIAAMQRTMTEQTYAQEVMAAFLADGTGVFRNVADACVLQEQPYEYGHQYVIGVDWGRSHDYTVFSVLDTTTRRQVALERSNKVEYHHQHQRLLGLAGTYKPIAIVAEANAMGEPIIEQLQRSNLPVSPFTTTNASKAAIIDALALAFEQGTVQLLEDATQLAELQAYTSERLPSGLIRYGAPSGQHDDCVMALALALYGGSTTELQPMDVGLVDALISYTGY